MEGFLCAASENSFSTLWLCRFLGIPGSRLPLLGWSSEMLLFVTASACFSVSTLFHPWSGSRLLPTPLTSLLDSVSVGSSRLGRVRALLENTASTAAHPISVPNMTQPALCCGFVPNYSSSPLSRGGGQQASSAPSHLGCFPQPFPLDPRAGDPVCSQSLLWPLG